MAPRGRGRKTVPGGSTGRTSGQAESSKDAAPASSPAAAPELGQRPRLGEESQVQQDSEEEEEEGGGVGEGEGEALEELRKPHLPDNRTYNRVILSHQREDTDIIQEQSPLKKSDDTNAHGIYFFSNSPLHALFERLLWRCYHPKSVKSLDGNRRQSRLYKRHRRHF
ncbi:histone H3 [Coccidioides immitis H538.4]|uniref:Histone H3 n=1 Tax=Coccidioides immitis H538.4 TaxID=396776 RepID=A0A0J8S154_COCIT|nr:histone H3 [Coccidioides immitis H538.4]